MSFADELATSRGLPAGSVPYPDPDGGGVNARVLFLLNDPGDGALADSGSGMLTVLNEDPTSNRQRSAFVASGLDRSLTLHWNGIPWPVTKAEKPMHVAAGARALLRLFDHLDEVAVVVTLGKFALGAWTEACAQTARFRGVVHFNSQHPLYSPGAELAGVYSRAREAVDAPT